MADVLEVSEDPQGVRSAAARAVGEDVVTLNEMIDELEPCSAFASAGPPLYASRCMLPRGHEGDHEFQSPEAARAAFYADCQRMTNDYDY